MTKSLSHYVTTTKERSSSKKSISFYGRRTLRALTLALLVGLGYRRIFKNGDQYINIRMARAAEELLLQSSSADSEEDDTNSSSSSSSPNNHSHPLVSFIIPSQLNRPTLNRTLQSLLNQTNPRWEALVGVDATRTGSNYTILKASQYLQDESRIQYGNVETPNKFRGRKGNGSAQVRNAIIQQFAKADWVAFVDDDDALSPYYVELLLESAKNHTKADIVLFRMQGYPQPTSRLPPLNISHFYVGDFGISFAAKRELFQRGVVFVPHPSEDFFYVRNAHNQGALVKVSTCTLYFIRQEPELSKPICTLKTNVNVTFSADGNVRSKVEQQ